MKPQGAFDILQERNRQISEEGYTAEHDAQHKPWEFSYAAIAYISGMRARYWPWSTEYFKREAPGLRNPTRRDLVRAGALIAAAIDRMDATDSPVQVNATHSDTCLCLTHTREVVDE